MSRLFAFLVKGRAAAALRRWWRQTGRRSRQAHALRRLRRRQDRLARRQAKLEGRYWDHVALVNRLAAIEGRLDRLGSPRGQQPPEASSSTPVKGHVACNSPGADVPAARCLIVSAGHPEASALAGDAALAQARLHRAFLPLLRREAMVWDLFSRQQSLDDAVQQARAEGLRPIHLTFAPLFAMRLAASAPNVAVSAWPYPDVPLGKLAGQAPSSWTRTLQQLSLLIAGSRFTQQAFRNAAAETPCEAIFPPVPAPFFDLPPWTPGATEIWEGPVYSLEPVADVSAEKPQVFPVAPRAELSGVVYTLVVNPAEVASNWLLLLDTYLEAFADRPQAVLAVKLVVEDGRDQPYVAAALQSYRTLARDHRCRLLLLPGAFDDERLLRLMAASAFVVSTSRAEGAGVSLQAALAAGRPVIAPRHAAPADYVDAQVGFAVKSRPEPAQLSPLLENSLKTVWHEVDRRSLIEALRASYEVSQRSDEYRRLGENGRCRMSELCSPAVVARQFFAALDTLV